MTPAPPPEPGLPPAVGTLRARRLDVVMTLVVFLGIVVLYALARGLSWDYADELAPWVVLPAVLIGVRTARLELTVGPGWVAGREILKRRWVRTDQLVRIRDTSSGPLDRNLDMVDADGRKASISLRDLRDRPEMHAQFAQDVRRSVEAGADASERVQRLLQGGPSRRRAPRAR